MIEYIEASDIESASTVFPYWTVSRWPYISAAIQFAKRCNPQTVLEAGSAGLPIAKEADTLDNKTHLGLAPTYKHDMCVFPWPVEHHYDLFVALQVWEHLQGRQRQAFREVSRIAKRAILSFPFKWKCSDTSHCGIDDDVIRNWTLGRPIADSVLVETPGKRRDRKVILIEELQ